MFGILVTYCTGTRSGRIVATKISTFDLHNRIARFEELKCTAWRLRSAGAAEGGCCTGRTKVASYIKG